MSLNPFKSNNPNTAEQALKNLNEEVQAAHTRVNLSNTRMKHIEHYLGLREHTFEEKDKRWNFNQIQTDIEKGVNPIEHQSIFNVA